MYFLFQMKSKKENVKTLFWGQYGNRLLELFNNNYFNFKSIIITTATITHVILLRMIC